MTAYKAMKNILKGDDQGMFYNRGDIHEYYNHNATRYAVILSADYRKGNKYTSLLVLQEFDVFSNPIPVKVRGGVQYADCALVSFSTDERIGEYVRTATDEEMAQIDAGIAKALGIEQKTVEVTVEKAVEVPVEVIKEVPVATNNVEELAAVKAEANIYKGLYEKLLEKMMG